MKEIYLRRAWLEERRAYQQMELAGVYPDEDVNRQLFAMASAVSAERADFWYRKARDCHE